MSRTTSLSKLTKERRNEIAEDLKIAQEISKYTRNTDPTYIYPYDVDGDTVYLPFSYDRSLPRAKRDHKTETKLVFEGELRPLQEDLQRQAVRQLNKSGSVVLSSYPGSGKTCTSISISCLIGLKTLVLIHRVVLIEQWKQSIHKFCPQAKVQILENGTELDEKCDFYIMNPLNVPKNERSFYKPIKFLIVDECHLIMAEQMSQAMLYIRPRYVLGLSATPYRVDGLNKLLDLYFGEERIVKKLWHPHMVYTLYSEFTPEVEMAKNGKVNWNSLLNSQAYDEQRNEMIVHLVKFFPKQIFLILCKRVAQGKHLLKRLKEEKESVTSLMGSEQFSGHDSRILIGTTSKCGVGFDHPRLNSLILASDIEQYFVQFLGRIFRTQRSNPMIIDIIDNHPILKKHAQTRRSVYIEHGGIIRDFERTFPDFQGLRKNLLQ